LITHYRFPENICKGKVFFLLLDPSNGWFAIGNKWTMIPFPARTASP
jgi:hypothetical protein